MTSSQGFSFRFIVVAFLVLLSVAVHRPAQAMDPKVKTVLSASLLGLIIGTAVGAATYPLHRQVKGIFIGSAVGLYAGLGVGVYHLFHHDDPQNPLNPNSPYRSDRGERPLAGLNESLRHKTPEIVGEGLMPMKTPAVRLTLAVFEF